MSILELKYKQHRKARATTKVYRNPATVWIAAAVTLATLLFGGALAAMHFLSPTETCENPIFAGPGGTTEQYTICFDSKEVFPNIVAYHGSTATPIRFGLKSVGKVLALSDGPNGGNAIIQVFTAPTSGLPQGTVTVWGSLKWISDTQSTVVMNGNANHQDFEEMRLDTPTGLIRNDLPDSYNLSTTPPGTVRNSTYTLSWLGRAQLAAMAAGAITDTTKLDMTFDLRSKLFTGTLPLPLQIAGEQLNSGLIITPSVVFSETGFKAGAVQDFQLRLGGLDVRVRNATLKPGEFTAGAADVLKNDNPEWGVVGTEAGNANLLFSILGLKYTTVDHKFIVQGGEVPIRDINMGGTVKLQQNRLGVFYDNPNNKTFIKIKSNVQFGAYLTSTQVITSELLFGRKVFTQTGQIAKFFEGGISAFTGNLGPLEMNISNAKLVGDAVTDFYGLNAGTIFAKWNSKLGGQTGAGMSGLKLGVNAASKFQFALNGGTVQFPTIQNGIFKGSGLGGTVSVISDTVTFTATANLQMKIAGGAKNPQGNTINPVMSMIIRSGPTVQDSCPGGNTPTCQRRVDGRIDAMTIAIASFKFALAGVRPIGDGGFAVQTATLSVPSVLAAIADQSGSTGFTVAGFQLNGDGSVTVAGGQINISAMKLGKISLGDFKLGFFREVVSDTVFYKATGLVTIGLPNMDPSGGSAVKGSLTIITSKDFGSPGIGDFEKIDGSLTLQIGGTGLPIGTTGMILRSIGGQVSWSHTTTAFTATVSIGSAASFAGIDLIRMDASLSVQVDPFLLRAQAGLKLLNFLEISSVVVEVGDGVGFNGCPAGEESRIPGPGPLGLIPNPACGPGKGFHAHFHTNKIIVTGDVDLRIGKVNGDTKLQGSAVYTVGMSRSQVLPLVPPVSFTLLKASFQVGQFTVPYGSHSTVGAFANLQVTDRIQVGVMMDFKEECCLTTAERARDNNDGKLFIIGTNFEGFAFVNPSMVQQMVARGEKGWQLTHISRKTGKAIDGPLAPELLDSPDIATAVSIPFVLTDTGTLIAGLHYTGTVNPAPQISLVLPNGITLTKNTINPATQEYHEELAANATEGSDISFVIGAAAPGNYQLLIENAPAQYDQVHYTLNNPPTLNNVVLGVGRLPLLLNWDAADADNSDAKVRVLLGKVYSGTAQADIGSAVVLSDNIALGAGSFLWNTEGLSTGDYQLIVEVSDGKNAPINVIASKIVSVVDITPPAVPTGLQAVSGPGRLSVSWTPNTEKDIAGYEIGFAFVNDVNQFNYSRDIGLKESFTGLADNVLRLRGSDGLDIVSSEDIASPGAERLDTPLWLPVDGQTIFYGIRAYDHERHYSAWTPLVEGKPWDISPRAWTPFPNGVGGGGYVEVAFPATLDANTLVNGVLTVRTAGGTPIPGSTETLLDSEGNPIGLRFIPSVLMPNGAYSAVITGGASGVKASDGRSMPDNYTWNFSVQNAVTLMPLLAR